jgi:RNA processing factor Prp31
MLKMLLKFQWAHKSVRLIKNTSFPFVTKCLELTEYRASLQEYLKNRMQTLAPNLTAVVGELVGARLICHAGSLVNLAKCPASTVQILGA